MAQNYSQQGMAPITGPLNLKDINSRLAYMALPMITRDQLDALVGSEPADRLTRALNLAATDGGARTYLARMLERVGVDLNQAPDTPPTPQSFEQPPPPPEYEPPPARPLPAEPPQQRGPAPVEPARQRGPAPAEQQSRPEGGTLKDDNISHHVYGGKAALCFETDTTRGGEGGKNAIYTVSLDAADSIGTRKYDWSKKVRIQMTRAELPVVTAVFMGMLPACEFKNHGPQSDKGFRIEDQGDKLFIKVFSKNAPVKAVPVTPEDAFEVAKLFIRQLRKNAPWMAGQDLITTINAVVARRKNQNQRQ